MVWSDSVGVSIVLPSDRVEGDQRNYIVIGEDVPTQIADHFTAALVFRSGQAGGDFVVGHGFAGASVNIGSLYPSGFIFWAIGITNNGALEIVAFYVVVGSPMSEDYMTYRQTVFSCAPPLGVDNPPVVSIGKNSNANTYDEAPTLWVRTAGRDPSLIGQGWGDIFINGTYNYGVVPGTPFTTIPGGDYTVLVPQGHTLEVDFKVPRVGVGANGGGAIRMILNGNIADAAEFSTGGGASLWTQGRLGGSISAVEGDLSVRIQIQLTCTAVAFSIAASQSGFVWFRYRIR